MPEDKPFKTETDQIKITPAADDDDDASVSVGTLSDAVLSRQNENRVPQGIAPTDRSHAQRIIKELPTEEFLDLLDHSSPDQIKSFLGLLTPSEVPLFQLSRKLFSNFLNIPDEPRDAFSIIAWWEARRFLFNFVLFFCGLPTLAIVYLFGMGPSHLIISGTVEYAILANICYTAGWSCELIARSWWKERAKHLGPILFSLGFTFSTLLTLGAGLLFVVLFFGLSFFGAKLPACDRIWEGSYNRLSPDVHRQTESPKALPQYETLTAITASKIVVRF